MSRCLVASLAFCLLPGVSAPCGYHSPSAAGLLNAVFPKSLYVRTAVWQASRAGDLAHGAEDASRFERERERMGALRAFASELAQTHSSGKLPAVAIVTVSDFVWMRVDARSADGSPQFDTHGPLAGDVVIVTDVPVLVALARSALDPADAETLGLMRFYGAQAAVESVRNVLHAQGS